MQPRRKIKKWIIVFSMFLLIFLSCTLYTNIEVFINRESIEQLINYAEIAKYESQSGGVTYYVSSDGTSDDGTDINNPMSLETANDKTFYGNDRVLLKRGDIFYGIINFNLDVNSNEYLYIGNYGDENKNMPIVTTSIYVDNENAWKEEKEGIYSIDLSNRNYVHGYKSIESQLYNIGFLKDEKNNIYGYKKENIEMLENEYDFYCDQNMLYIKTSENPTKKLGKITFSTRNSILYLTSNTIVDGLIIQDTGALGVTKSKTYIENSCIINSIIQNIGGSYHSGTTRYGNGVELWNYAKNTLVENCIFRDIFDAAYTLQGNSIEDGFYNNVCRNNIFIRCTYPFEFSCHNNYNTENVHFGGTILEKNIIIEQGKGWGFYTREDKYQASCLVAWIIPKLKNGKNYFRNNSIFNSRSLYYKYTGTSEETFAESFEIDNNTFYLNDGTLFFIDSEEHYDSSILEEYGFDQNSSFNYLSDEEIEIISNPNILNSNDYDEIKEYYDNFDKKYNTKKAAQDLLQSIDSTMNSEKYKNLLNNNSINNLYLSLRNAINNLSESIDLTTKDSVSYSYECLYDLMETVSNEYYANNLSEDVDETYIKDFIKDLDSLSSGYKEIYSYFVTEDNIDVSTIKNILNNAIEKYNNNLDLNIGYLEDIISTAKKIYNNYLTTDNVYENVFNKERITYITDVVNNILDVQINKAVESEKSKIKVEFDKDTTQPTSENIIATITIGDETKINNNNGSNKYTFYENGTFTFDLEIREVKFDLGITINNISKNYKIEDGYITNITKNTLASTLKNELNISNYSIIRNGQEINLNTNVVSTGDILTYNDKSYTLIVNGDINKDGSCGIHDLVSFRKYLLKYITYDDIESMAADTNQDKELDIKDLVGIRKIILN